MGRKSREQCLNVGKWEHFREGFEENHKNQTSWLRAPQCEMACITNQIESELRNIAENAPKPSQVSGSSYANNKVPVAFFSPRNGITMEWKGKWTMAELWWLVFRGWCTSFSDSVCSWTHPGASWRPGSAQNSSCLWWVSWGHRTPAFQQNLH